MGLTVKLHRNRNFYECPECYPCDVTRIQSAVINHGFHCTRAEAERLWDLHSDDYCAGWLFLPDDEETLWSFVKHYVEDADEIQEETSGD